MKTFLYILCLLFFISGCGEKKRKTVDEGSSSSTKSEQGKSSNNSDQCNTEWEKAKDYFSNVRAEIWKDLSKTLTEAVNNNCFKEFGWKNTSTCTDAALNFSKALSDASEAKTKYDEALKDDLIHGTTGTKALYQVTGAEYDKALNALSTATATFKTHCRE